MHRRSLLSRIVFARAPQRIRPSDPPVRESLESRVLSWGDLTHAGHGHGHRDVPVPTSIPQLERAEITQIACGWGNSCAVDQQGNVYEWGMSYDAARILQLAMWRKRFPNLNYILMDSAISKVIGFAFEAHASVPVKLDLAGVEMDSVDSGCGFSVGITKHGRIIRWGEMQFSLAGRKLIKDYEPSLVDEERKFTKIACGLGHFMAIDQDGDIWGCGSPEALGVGPLEKYSLDLLGPLWNIREKIDEYVSDFKWFGRAKDVSCGVGYSALLTEDGKLYTFGKGVALGLNNQLRSELIPCHVDIFDGEKVAHISAGAYHMCAITESSRVFTWGVGTDGQCGRYKLESRHLKERAFYYPPGIVSNIPPDFKPVKASCGTHHTALISSTIISCFFFILLMIL
jgi:RCC1 and BTB domain-containing protein